MQLVATSWAPGDESPLSLLESTDLHYSKSSS